MIERIELVRGDITRMNTDAIVNAANSSLMGGGGVDGAIHRAGGPAILEECKKIVAEHGSCPVGEAVVTTGGLLPGRYVIHTVGPVWNGGNDHENEKLASCYRNSLAKAAAHQIKTIAFPNISTGVYRFPKPAAAHIAVTSVKEALASMPSVDKVYFVCFDEENFNLYRKLLSA
jgi:O-acetyl-ADP-ribose deacetylase (regulator of RNase III)